jgi:hypothetical protein
MQLSQHLAVEGLDKPTPQAFSNHRRKNNGDLAVLIHLRVGWGHERRRRQLRFRRDREPYLLAFKERLTKPLLPS